MNKERVVRRGAERGNSSHRAESRETGDSVTKSFAADDNKRDSVQSSSRLLVVVLLTTDLNLQRHRSYRFDS